ncbi:ferrous iron transporter B [Porticoccaceae bacterium]|jgi:ferrous iron transport protein B|nr:ferrous iron transporter B [Porticoccaceae bacterium]MDB2594272.1 ferrous iron transporter B [Porticoccaceae bacterium]
MSSTQASRIALIGSPNSGKSLLFNRLTGLNQKVANFPGITVNIASGQSLHDSSIQYLDFPGVYSMQAISGEEKVAVEAFISALEDNLLDAVVCVVDSTRLEKGLIFALQVLETCHRYNKPVLIAANMVDVLDQHSMQFDASGLSEALKVSVLPLSAKTGAGLEQISQSLADTTVPPEKFQSDIIASDDSVNHLHAQELAEKYGPRGDLLINTQTRLDSFFLHSWFGGLSFLVIMYLLFQSIFTWAAPAMDGVEASIQWLASVVLPLIPAGVASDFTSDALFGGIGAFLVFVPQIFVLTLVVGMLEDSGYLARAAVICHKPLRFFGLTGKSFIPMLSGVACAIPGVYAARTVESTRKRWLTYLAIPLMPCSARLPVYSLIIAAFIPAQKAMGGLVGWQGLAMFAIYLFGILCALLVTALVSRSNAELRTDLPFVLEMPPYRLPSWRPLIINAWNRSKHFVTKAGKVIFAVTVVIWVLGYFPNYGTSLGDSWLGTMGQWIEPLFAPFGLDWRYGVAILSSFLAREVFVGTLGTMFGIEGAEENFTSLAQQIQDSGLPLGAGAALLVFFAIALQCVSTLAVLQRETGSWRLPLQLFISYSIFAYTAALAVFHLVELLV